MKKIVDVPEGAEEFLFEAYENDMLVGKTQEGYVSSLPDAPEKRVIELPADVIGRIKNVARNTMNVYEFLVEIENELPNVTNVGWNTLADWFLGHTKFVAKKEPRYAVETKFGYVMAVYNGYGKKLGVSEFTYDDYTQDLTEVEADSMVVGLGGEEGLLKPRKVKVED